MNNFDNFNGVKLNPSDLSGWPLHKSERRDFFHRNRQLPEEVRAWRDELVQRVMSDRKLFLALPEAPEQPKKSDQTRAQRLEKAFLKHLKEEEQLSEEEIGARKQAGKLAKMWAKFLKATKKLGKKEADRLLTILEHAEAYAGHLEEARRRVDQGLVAIREIARIVAAVYKNPRLGNPKDPVDDLVYILLSRRTHENAYQKIYSSLKEEFASWDELLEAPRERVEELVRPGGMVSNKLASLYGPLEKLRETFGSCTLEPARSWDDEKLEKFLCSLPAVGRKSALCVMMYAFDRPVFPVDTHVGRVLTRVGLFRELGLDLSDLDQTKHRTIQRILADLIPPNLRYSLHVNLLVHGREVCRLPEPRCDQCVIRKFCSTWRQRQVEVAESSEAPTTVDLFCGAGGLSAGFAKAGCRPLLALDLNETALKTYRFNHPQVPDERVLCTNIRDLEPGELKRRIGDREIDILLGAPPCQGFSSVGFRSKPGKTGYLLGKDERNTLFEGMVEAALELRPKLFLMENVPGMQSARKANLSYLEIAKALLEEGGEYRARIWKINAAALGVPQNRVRYFLVASRIGRLPARPEEDYQDRMHRGQFSTELDQDFLDSSTFEEATFDLPPLAAGCGEAVEVWERQDFTGQSRYRDYLKKFSYLNKFKLLGDSPLVFNHTVRFHNERDLELYRLIEPDEDAFNFLERLKRDDLMVYRRDVFDDKYYKLRPDAPSKTIVAHLAKDGNGYIHPGQVRSITLREAARLQSFPDDFAFCGSGSDQWIQLGNAVPPVVSHAIAKSFLRTLEKARSI